MQKYINLVSRHELSNEYLLAKNRRRYRRERASQSSRLRVSAFTCMACEKHEFARARARAGSRRGDRRPLWTGRPGESAALAAENRRPDLRGMRASSEVAQERRTRTKLTLSCSSHIQETLNCRARFPSVHGSSNANYGILTLSNMI